METQSYVCTSTISAVKARPCSSKLNKPPAGLLFAPRQRLGSIIQQAPDVTLAGAREGALHCALQPRHSRWECDGKTGRQNTWEQPFPH